MILLYCLDFWPGRLKTDVFATKIMVIKMNGMVILRRLILFFQPRRVDYDGRLHLTTIIRQLEGLRIIIIHLTAPCPEDWKKLGVFEVKLTH